MGVFPIEDSKSGVEIMVEDLKLVREFRQCPPEDQLQFRALRAH